MKQRFGFGPSRGRRDAKEFALMQTVRETAGPDIEIMADAYMGWDVPYAIRMIRMIEDAGLDLRWVEEPVIPDDIQGYAGIRRAVTTPIWGGEHEFTRFGFRQLIAEAGGYPATRREPRRRDHGSTKDLGAGRDRGYASDSAFGTGS